MTQSFQKIGFHIDLRVQAMPIQALRRQAKELAAMGYNTLMVEWEGTYPFKKHAVISNKYSYTRKEIAEFIRDCKTWGLDVIPLQQCFGHVEYILQHARYAGLREDNRDLCQLCPCKTEEALKVFSEIFSDIAAMHPSPFIHIGGDETYLLGNCPQCQAKAKKYGKSKLYVDYFKKVSSLIMTLGKRPMLWADVLLAYPEAIPDLPKEAVFVDWNYGWDPHRFGSLANIKKFELWGAPSLRSAPDSHSLSTWKIHFDNYKDYIPFARKSAFASTVLTSWSTSGEYGYEWETHGDVLEILPMRRVYPLAGFRILAAANIEAVKNKSPLSPKKFVIRYTQERFGLSARDGARLYDALTTNEAFLPSGVDAKVLEKAAKAAVKARRTLHALKPLRNKTELAHIQLMADFRELHTRLRKVEARIQSEKFALSHVPALQKELTKLVQENKKATSRYLKLNRAYLYPQQLEEETAYRTKKLHLLHQRLSRAGRD